MWGHRSRRLVASSLYRRVEWLGGPWDGEIVLVKNGVYVMKFPSQISVINAYRNPNTRLSQFDIPIREVDGKEYLIWSERTLLP